MADNYLNHPHILAAVLRKFNDPEELIKLRLVSKMWKEEIDRVLNFSMDWMAFCKKKLGPFAYSTLIKTILPKASYKDFDDITKQSDWMKIFYTAWNWYSTINFKRLRINCTKRLMWNRFTLHDNKLITCLDVWSNFIASGSTKGSIHIFANFSMIKPYYIINTGEKQINKIQFWFTASEKLLLVSLDTDGYVKFWDVHQRTQKFINEPEIYNGLNLYVNTSRSLFIALRNQIVRLQLLPTSEDEITVSKCDLDLTGENHRVLTINFFERDIVSAFVWTRGSWCQCFYYYNNIIDDPKNLDASKMHRTYMPQIDLNPEDPFFTFLNKSVMSVQSNCLLILHNLDYWKAIAMTRTFSENIKSLIWHGNSLLLGLQNGQIQIHYLEDLRDLAEKRVFIYRTPRIIEVDSEPIIDLKIGHIKNKPVIIAATKNCIHKILAD